MFDDQTWIYSTFTASTELQQFDTGLRKQAITFP